MGIVSGIADILSILGFGITLVTYVAVRGIRQKLIYDKLVPELIVRVRDLTVSINELYSEYEAKKLPISEALSQLEVAITDLKQQFRGDEQYATKALENTNRVLILLRFKPSKPEGPRDQLLATLHQIEAYKNQPTQEALWQVYLEAVKLRERLKNIRIIDQISI